jgi:hypothetical protein
MEGFGYTTQSSLGNLLAQSFHLLIERYGNLPLCGNF